MSIKIKKEALLIEPAILKPSSKDYEVLGTLNPGAARLPDGKIVLYIRVIEKLKKNEDKRYCYSPRMVGKTEFKIKIDRFKKSLVKESADLDFQFKDGTKRLKFISHFRKVILDKNGFKILSIDQKPAFFGLATDGELGVEDPRITKIGDTYAMTYVSLSREQNISTSIAFSKDLINWDRKGIIFGEQDKDVVIFPDMINGKYVAFDRPEGNFMFSAPHIWIGYSNDLLSWGELKPIGCLYEEHGSCPRNGSGPPPIKTNKGWLLLYHVVTNRDEKVKAEPIDPQEKRVFLDLKKLFGFKRITLEKEPETVIKQIAIYNVGAVLFDIDNPEKILARTHHPLMSPSKKYDMGSFEKKGVVFPTGAIVDTNEKDLLIYSGSGDSVTTVKKVGLEDIFKSLIPEGKRKKLT